MNSQATEEASVTRDVHTDLAIDFILANVSGDERPYLNVEVLGQKILGLLDSGASRTIVGGKGYELFKGLGLKHLPADIESCRVANGEVCNVLCRYSVPFRVGDRVCILDVLVVPSIPTPLILGTDFWRRMGIIPNIRSGQWTFTTEPTIEVSSIVDCSHLTSSQSSRLTELLDSVFANMNQELGCVKGVQHVIKTTSEPIRQRCYPISPALRKHVDAELDDMLKKGVVEPSSSPWASPIVMVKKKDGSYRFCIDYRKINRVTERDAYPLPPMTQILDRLRDGKYLSSLDIKSAYWQMPMDEASKPITAFTVPFRGLFQFRRMPMGLSNSPATWQRCIDSIIGGDLEHHVFVYLDDIVIVSQDFETHLEVLGRVLKRLTDAGLTLARAKCQFCRSELKYLGYVVSENGLHVDPDKVKAILDLPIPTNVSGVRRIIGVASWYRRFIPNFSSKIAPITNLMRKNVKFCWSHACTEAFNSIKEHLISAPVMSCPNFDEKFQVQTDASDFGLGAVLTQNFSGQEQVISYISRSLTPNERKYSTTEKECLAVVWAIEKFRPYIEATHFEVITDHFSLQWLHNLKVPCGRLARWSVRLQQFSFDVIHRKGRDHVVPDCLSRSVPVANIQADTPIFPNIVDPWYDKIKQNILENPLRFPLWRVANGYVHKKLNTPNKLGLPDYKWLLVVPKNCRRDVIQQNHDRTTCGHCGVFKTFHRVCEKYYWPKMRYDIARYVKFCIVCQQNKSEQAKPKGLMLGRPEVSKPWEVISVDLVGPLPKSKQGYMHIFSIQDYFSKFCLFVPLRTANSKSIVTALEEQVFLLFGVPRYIICDNGKQFVSKEFKNLLENYSVGVTHTAYYHAQANPCERQHRTLKTMLAAYVKDDQRNWSLQLQKVACAMRTSKHECSQLTPYFTNFGHEICLNGREHTTGLPDGGDSIKDKPPDFQKIYRFVQSQLSKSYKKSQQHYNLRHRDVKFTVGQKVLHKNYTQSDAGNYYTAKLAAKYVGPYIVRKVLSPWTYELADLQDKFCGIWHIKDLKEYFDEDGSDTNN